METFRFFLRDNCTDPSLNAFNSSEMKICLFLVRKFNHPVNGKLLFFLPLDELIQ